MTRQRTPPPNREIDETWMPPGKSGKDYNRLSKEVTDLPIVNTFTRRNDVERRGMLKAFLATVAAAWSAPRFVFAQRGQAAPAPVPETKHIRLYVEMDIAPASEGEV